MFEVGDKVIYDDMTGNLYPYVVGYPPNGLNGIIKAVNPSDTDGLDYAVEFEGYKGHSCNGVINSLSGFWCGADELTKVYE